MAATSKVQIYDYLGEFLANNKHGTAEYYDADKNKKYLLVYENGRLLSQREIIDEI